MNAQIFKNLGVMLDCSRNAVMTVNSVKRLVDDLSLMGYNRLMLYMEDTYEVKEEPYFGYFRGRYTSKELKEIDDYGFSKGIEVIPCIQTLAHFTAMLKLEHYKNIKDIEDILLVGNDETYALIEKMISSLRDSFRTNIIHIGMDEAHHLGRGKYADINGFERKEDIFLAHLNRVCEIAAKYHFEPMIWSDMFYRIFAKGDYYASDIQFENNITERIPNHLSLVYWDYYHIEKEHFDKMFASHKKLSGQICFAGGAWKWTGIIPDNSLSLVSNKNAFLSASENNIDDAYITLWGDDGAEASLYSVLPTLAACACYNTGIFDESVIKQQFKKWFGVNFDSFMLLELPDKNPDLPLDYVVNPSKYLLFNDCFLGKYDSCLKDGCGKKYLEIADKIKRIIPETGRFEYLFDTVEKLCRALEIKAEIGIKTREAYSAKNMVAVKTVIEDYKEIILRIDALYRAVRKQWFAENKPNGFEVLDIRYGGLIKRIESCQERLRMFADGEIGSIDELNEKPLLEDKVDTIAYRWINIVTNNVI